MKNIAKFTKFICLFMSFWRFYKVYEYNGEELKYIVDNYEKVLKSVEGNKDFIRTLLQKIHGKLIKYGITLEVTCDADETDFLPKITLDFPDHVERLFDKGC